MIRLEMNKKQEAILAAIIIAAALGVFVLYTGIVGRVPEPEVAAEEPAAPPLTGIIASSMEDQEKIDEGLYSALESGMYRFDTPLVAVNPYGTSPLTAFIMFQTEEVVSISVKIAGKSEDVSVRHSWSGFETNHMIPVFGLYPGMVNMVEITMTPSDASKNPAQTNVLFIETEAMPEGFPENNILEYSGSFQVPVPLIYDMTADPGGAYEPPFYFTHVKKSAFDTNGDYRWCYNGFKTQRPSAYTENGNLLIAVDSEDGSQTVIVEMNMFGRIIGFAPYGEAEYEARFLGAHQATRRELYAN